MSATSDPVLGEGPELRFTSGSLEVRNADDDALVSCPDADQSAAVASISNRSEGMASRV